MMDDDWDLHAVVRGCAAAITTNTTATNNPLPCSPTFPSHNDKTLFDFPGLIDDRNDDDPFLGLHEIYQEFFLDPPPPPPSTTTTTEPTSTPVARVSHYFQEVLQIQTSTQRQESIQFKNPMQVLSPPPVSFPAMNPQPNLPRRRKNQQLKMIRQMTQEELSADSWAWRKYGQKPIKGSPYPSTSKGCAARKQVERSVNDPGVFVVSYTGEHTHPRPIHRSSLAGTTRNKSAATKDNNRSNTTNTLSLQKGSSTPASNVSCSSFSTSTQLMEGEPMERNDDVEMAEEEDNNIMMLNELMNDEDIYKRFRDSDESSGCGGGCF